MVITISTILCHTESKPMSPRFFKLMLLITLGLALPLTVWLTLPQPQAFAQCGKTASSCKTCHETQGKLKVNTKGEWHTQHAFGDFCVYCHAGNAQAKDKAKAHTGLVNPLADVTYTCAACHTEDCSSRAQEYASVLGVTAGQGSGGTSPRGPAPLIPLMPRLAGTGDTPALPGQTTSPFAGSGLSSGQGSAETPSVNWGNVALALIALALLLGGGGYALWNERRILTTVHPSEWDDLIKARPELGEVMPLLARADAQTVHVIAQTLERKSKT
jgi:hypothetical protein